MSDSKPDPLKLGQLIEGEARKDATHVAIAPVIAGEKLAPGDPIAIVDGKAVESASPIGVVDPFLRKTLKPGDNFWMMLYPGTVTGLRHEWDHPSFLPKEPDPEEDYDDGCRGCY